MTPVETLKHRIFLLEGRKDTIEDRLDGLDRERDELMDDFKKIGLELVDLKAAIKKLEEK